MKNTESVIKFEIIETLEDASAFLKPFEQLEEMISHTEFCEFNKKNYSYESIRTILTSLDLNRKNLNGIRKQRLGGQLLKVEAAPVVMEFV